MMIRKMTVADAEAISKIEEQCFSQPWSKQSFVQAAQDENALFLVACEEDQPVGYAGMYLSAPEGEITNVAVMEAFRGKGIAKALMRQQQVQSATFGIDRIVLEVRVSNASAIAAYEGTDFVIAGIRKNFYSFPKEDAQIMVWERN